MTADASGGLPDGTDGRHRWRGRLTPLSHCVPRNDLRFATGGRTYTHRCELSVFEKVAWVLEETPDHGRGVALNEIAAAEKLPHTQVDITLAFLHQRGIIDRRHRRSYPASTSVHLDAMVEWHALREVPA